MPLDPHVRALLDEMASQELPPPEQLTVEQNREAIMDMRELAGPAEEVETVVDISADGVPVRIYAPAGEKPLPVLVFFHGGGWVIGNLDTHDAVCRQLANRAGCVVAAVDYRLAPENPFPAAVEDAYAATAWIARNASAHGGDGTRLAVGGDSAGGNLTAVVSQLARDRGGPALAFQLLIYPAVNATDDSPSMTENADGYFLTRALMDWFFAHYVTNPDDARNPLVSPALTADLSGLPPALVITAEYDPLRDQGVAYAKQLADAGVPVEHVNYDGMIHAFYQMPGLLGAARDAIAKSAAALRAAFG
ncbi:alpha/beta hydrolase [Fodinicola acaciae]|uniref:alpha/beta hydrolase n=1 Tax=Fodinicola acaciae TaxID=2681555 RepID=UPI0013D821CA|nr:alpha/beta hydrolase [Fodinicola acaciae]